MSYFKNTVYANDPDNFNSEFLKIDEKEKAQKIVRGFFDKNTKK